MPVFVTRAWLTDNFDDVFLPLPPPAFTTSCSWLKESGREEGIWSSKLHKQKPTFFFSPFNQSFELCLKGHCAPKKDEGREGETKRESKARRRYTKKKKKKRENKGLRENKTIKQTEVCCRLCCEPTTPSKGTLTSPKEIKRNRVTNRDKKKKKHLSFIKVVSAWHSALPKSGKKKKSNTSTPTCDAWLSMKSSTFFSGGKWSYRREKHRPSPLFQLTKKKKQCFFFPFRTSPLRGMMLSGSWAWQPRHKVTKRELCAQGKPRKRKKTKQQKREREVTVSPLCNTNKTPCRVRIRWVRKHTYFL